MHLYILGIFKKYFEKDRLYVGLYALDGSNNTYQCALIVGPKSDQPCCPATSYRARQAYNMTLSDQQEIRWVYQEKQTRICRRGGLVARVMLGKIRDTRRLASILRRVPMRAEVQDWDSVSWVKEGLEEIEKDGRCLGASVTAARRIEYGEPDGEEGDRIPTFDMLLKKET